MADVSNFKSLASRLIQKNGQQVQIVRIADGVPGSTPWKPGAPSESSETVLATVFDIEDEKVDGTLVQRGDKLALISAADVTGARPTTADFLVIGGVRHKVINLKTISPSDDDVLYKLQVRA